MPWGHGATYFSAELLVLEVTPETTGQELKHQIKEGQVSWEQFTFRTTGVEVIVGDDHLLANDAKILDAGIAEDTVVSVVFKPHVVICSNKDKTSPVFVALLTPSCCSLSKFHMMKQSVVKRLLRGAAPWPK